MNPMQGEALVGIKAAFGLELLADHGAERIESARINQRVNAREGGKQRACN
jgi:hypothetical protein